MARISGLVYLAEVPVPEPGTTVVARFAPQPNRAEHLADLAPALRESGDADGADQADRLAECLRWADRIAS